MKADTSSDISEVTNPFYQPELEENTKAQEQEMYEKQRARIVPLLLSTSKKKVEAVEYLTHEILLDEVVNGYNDMLRHIITRGKPI